ncbi:uncharacterized protein B0I36DRAFT_356207 [Microdochium trichocladiopsis]|uniref:Uncharacterized protein n=1 Tax=Microdochium trichocladiopsis TaxID=1682393 RepID=A0A9P9BHM4_9PEZI|nr:uncharacterized protein B0I36DRAFT_356207 [Microdochium trichocladiopsis]KAH7012109.1 hypothetical protein B0I36DRAFT_356207 [Microdochium trichocladiopsis]
MPRSCPTRGCVGSLPFTTSQLALLLDESIKLSESPVRCREVDRSPVFLPRVGERPAGAERAGALIIPVLMRAAGGLGLSKERGQGQLSREELWASLMLADFVIKKREGLMKRFLYELSLLSLCRLEIGKGIRFQKSVSTGSVAFRLVDDVGY